jgi:hypothetical protein
VIVPMLVPNLRPQLLKGYLTLEAILCLRHQVGILRPIGISRLVGAGP